MIKPACKGGSTADKPTSVCGEVGGDLLLALVLVSLGASSLPMTSKRVLAVHAALRLHDRATCQQMAAYAVGVETAADVKATVTALVDPKVKGLLQSGGINIRPGVHTQLA